MKAAAWVISVVLGTALGGALGVVVATKVTKPALAAEAPKPARVVEAEEVRLVDERGTVRAALGGKGWSEAPAPDGVPAKAFRSKEGGWTAGLFWERSSPDDPAKGIGGLQEPGARTASVRGRLVVYRGEPAELSRQWEWAQADWSNAVPYRMPAPEADPEPVGNWVTFAPNREMAEGRGELDVLEHQPDLPGLDLPQQPSHTRNVQRVIEVPAEHFSDHGILLTVVGGLVEFLGAMVQEPEGDSSALPRAQYLEGAGSGIPECAARGGCAVGALRHHFCRQRLHAAP